ncbi:hypothetical protein C7M84_014219 [Penaeus vannamei]|uniref:Uncharacterized protein n=1 Tax=Penaeus vannamei TaxID=6689 RepID=A0A3R7PDU2_PENVA|nr:hypothetical protein C7M84_014219 [Penaeus vannamei]
MFLFFELRAKKLRDCESIYTFIYICLYPPIYPFNLSGHPSSRCSGARGGAGPPTLLARRREALGVDRATLTRLSRDERYDDSGRMCRILQLAVGAGRLQSNQELVAVLRKFLDSHLVPTPPVRRL